MSFVMKNVYYFAEASNERVEGEGVLCYCFDYYNTIVLLLVMESNHPFWIVTPLNSTLMYMDN